MGVALSDLLSPKEVSANVGYAARGQARANIDTTKALAIPSILCTTRKGTPDAMQKPFRVLDHVITRPAPFLRLPVDVHLGIAWAIAAGSASMADVYALGTACWELSSCLRDSHHQLWIRKADVILGGSGLGSGMLPLSPRQVCIRLLVVGRLLQSALTSCDWLALFDASEVLISTNLLGREAWRGANVTAQLVLMHRVLVRLHGQPPTLQALQWLLDLATGRERPWSGASRPGDEVIGLDRLREWLHLHVSVSILPWHRLEAFRLDASYDGLFPRHVWGGLAGRVRHAAAALLLAVECAPPPPDGGLQAVAPLAELAVGVEWALRCEGREDAQRFWAPGLLLLARCLQLLQRRNGMVAVWEDLGAEAEAADAFIRVPVRQYCGSWHGVAVAWQPAAAVEADGAAWPQPLPEHQVTPEAVEALMFPRLFLDERWLHSQHGKRGPLGGSQASRQVATVQVDARFNRQMGCFVGHWIEYGISSTPLPVRAFPLGAGCGGLREWMKPFVSVVISVDGQVSPDEVTELFGVAGGVTGDILRCFHLTRL